jgi:twitching motility protein PilT
MLRSAPNISDLIFSPGRPPQVGVNGQLLPVQIPQTELLSADDTRRIASELLGNNTNAIAALREHGACDASYGVPGLSRFRVNVFIQRGSCAVVMRVIPTQIPTFDQLGLPTHLEEIANLHDGIVLVAGASGAGKSSTLAAILDVLNEKHSYHIITIEDPLEFLHNHKRCTIHQRELHSDAPSFTLALKAALRQSPKVILVGSLRDRETIETVLEAAETGHLVLSSLRATDCENAVERLVTSFDPSERPALRSRLARTLRYVVCQRLVPRKSGEGMLPAVEILKSSPAVRHCIELGSQPGATLLQTIHASEALGMQSFDHDLTRLVRSGLIDADCALSHATHPQELRRELGL